MRKRSERHKTISKRLLLLGAAILAGGCFLLMSPWLSAQFALKPAGEGDAGLPQAITTFQRLEGIEDEQSALARSADGEVFATGGRDGLIRFWDGRSGALLAEVMGHPHGVVDLAFSPDGERLASTGRRERIIRIWDVKTGKLRETAAPSLTVGTVDRVVFSPDGKKVLFTGENEQYQFVLFWEIEAQTQSGRLAGHEDLIASMAFSPGGDLLATGGYDNIVHIWDWASRTEKIALQSPSPVLDVAFSPGGEMLAAGLNDSSVYIWKVQSGEVLGVLRGHAFSVFAVAFSPDGSLLASGDSEKIQLWEVSTFTLAAQLRSDARAVRGITFGPDGNALFSVSGSGRKGGVFLWDLPVLAQQDENP